MSKLDEILRPAFEWDSDLLPVKEEIKALMMQIIGENQYGPTKEIEYERNSLRDRMRMNVSEL